MVQILDKTYSAFSGENNPIPNNSGAQQTQDEGKQIHGAKQEINDDA